MAEPTTFRAGETISFEKDLSDYLASDGWACKYRFIGLNGAQAAVAGAASGSTYTLTFASAITANYAAGIYKLYGWVEKSATLERYQVYEGQCEILADLTTATATDMRSHAKKTYDLICTAIENHATNPLQSYTIGGRTRTNWSMIELLRLKNHYAWLVREEERKERINNGEDGGGLILVRFQTTS